MEHDSPLPNTAIKPIDVYEVLESRKFVDEIFNRMLRDIKNSSAYIDLKEIAIHHFASIEASKNDEPIERKKKQTYDVGYLSDCIASTLSKTVHDKLLVLKDEVYAATQSVIQELEMKNSDAGEVRYPETSLPEQNGSAIPYSSTPKKKNGKRCTESNSDIDVLPSKRLSNRLKKPNSKYYSENILTSVTDYCFGDAFNKS